MKQMQYVIVNVNSQECFLLNKKIKKK